MNKRVEFNGKKYQAVKPTEKNEGKKTDCCGTCAFRTLNWKESDFPKGENVGDLYKNNPWCFFNGSRLSISREGLDCRLNGKRIHWKKVK